MPKFYPITVRDVYKEANDTTVVTFDIPEELQETFAFRPGQHLILKTDIDGEEVRRTYSLCSGPAEKEWTIAVKQIHEGVFSTYVNEELKPGQILELMPPSGTFGVPLETKKAKKYIAFAAGSGITPILSIIKTHLASPKARATFQLFYLNKTAKSIIFKEEIEALRNRFFGRLEVYYFLSREHRDIELFNGRFTEEKVKQLTQTLINVKTADECFICGPEQMIFTIRDTLMGCGLEKRKIHYELFVSGLSEEALKKTERALQERVDGTEVTVYDGGRAFHFTMTEDYDNILDGALAAGADLPFACKGGVCSTCKCELKEGKVAMKVNYALEKDDLEKNHILSCQSVPTSKKVVVDFDV